MDYNFMSKNGMCTGKNEKQGKDTSITDNILLIKLPKPSAFSS